MEMVTLSFASDLNTSTYKVLIPATGQVTTTNQLDFDENFFPYQKGELIMQSDEGDAKVDILFKASSPMTWLKYYPSINLSTCTKMHMGSGRNLIC